MNYGTIISVALIQEVGVTYMNDVPFSFAVRVELSSEQLRRIKFIDLADFGHVAKSVLERFHDLFMPIPEGHIERGIFALKQYYALEVLDPAHVHVVSKLLEPFVHAHILQTQGYHSFCKRLVGEYIHHQPLSSSREDETQRLYEATLEVLQKFFIEIDSRFWPLYLPNQTSYGTLQRAHRAGTFAEINFLSSRGTTL